MNKKKISIVIPARLKSTRFPNKILEKILGLPMIEYVRRRALLSKYIDEVVVATPDKKIEKIITNYGGKCIRTKFRHLNGTSRVAEACKKINCTDIIILQGDEPLILPYEIDLLAKKMLKTNNSSYTYNCIGKINKKELFDKSVVKIEVDKKNNIINCFRYEKNKKYKSLYKLFGVIGFNKNVLIKLMKTKSTENEKKFSIEQMRIIHNNLKLKAFLIKGSGASVNYKKDLTYVRKTLRNSKTQKKISFKVLNKF